MTFSPNSNEENKTWFQKYIPNNKKLIKYQITPSKTEKPLELKDYKIELILEKEFIILKPKVEPRKNWEKAFKKMHENGDDKLLIDDIFGDENLDEWN